METNRYQELQNQYMALHSEKAKIEVLLEMAMEIRNLDADEALVLADEIIARAEKEEYLLAKGRGLNIKGWCFWQKGDYDEGIAMLRGSLEIAHQLKNKPLEARVLNNFGNIFRDKGDLAEALNYFDNALAINESLGDEVAQSVNMASIAYLHYDLNDYANALEFALRCLPVFEKANDVHRLTLLYHILGNIYFKKQQFAEALKYFEENLDHSEPDTVMHVMGISGLGKVYYKMNNLDYAEKFLLEALEKAEELGSVEVQIISQFYLGKIAFSREDYTKALSLMHSAFDLSDEYERKHDTMSIHEALSEVYDRIQDIPKAYHHLKEYERLKEDIFQQTTFNKLRNLQTRQQIQLAKKEKEVAEKTASLKQQFLANMSHEIRTPMNAIVGMTQLLLNLNPGPRELKYLQAIKTSADNLLVIINDILDLSRIEAGKIEIESTDFELREVLHSVKDMLILKAEEKQISLKYTLDESIPTRLIGDPSRLNQILINLAGNAVKFTNKGGVEIQVKPYKQSEEKNWIQFDIIDTGIGIAPDYVEKIFESFTQAGTDVARQYGGTGLGLTISKELVELMGGQISVVSELGIGTTFTVIIPFQTSRLINVSQKAPRVNKAVMDRLRTIRLLLVEDNEFNRMVAEDTLKELLPEIQITVAHDGRQAVDLVRQQSFDLILMDIQMPIMDGVEATRQIREELPSPAREVKIIAMTANVLSEDVERYLKAGMNAYVSKPFHTEELLLKMASVLINGAANLQENPSPPAPTDAQRPIPDQVTQMNFLAQFTAGDQEKKMKYIRMFLENGPRLIRQVREALDSRNYAQLKIAAHSLKPQLSYMGIREEDSRIFLIEQIADKPAHHDRLPDLVDYLEKICEKAFEELNREIGDQASRNRERSPE